MTLTIGWIDNSKKIEMRYSVEPRDRKYVEGYGFLLFEKRLNNKHGKEIIDTAT